MLLELSMTKTKSSGMALQGFSATKKKFVMLSKTEGTKCSWSLVSSESHTHCTAMECCVICPWGTSGVMSVHLHGVRPQQAENAEGHTPHSDERGQLQHRSTNTRADAEKKTLTKTVQDKNTEQDFSVPGERIDSKQTTIPACSCESIVQGSRS